MRIFGFYMVSSDILCFLHPTITLRAPFLVQLSKASATNIHFCLLAGAALTLGAFFGADLLMTNGMVSVQDDSKFSVVCPLVTCLVFCCF